MKLQELHDRIVETMNLEVITQTSLIVCVNNCFADLMSRGYRDFIEEVFTTDGQTVPTDLSELSFPMSLDIPTAFRRLQYLKVITEMGTTNAERVILSSSAYLGYLDTEGNLRVNFGQLMKPYAYYVLDDKIHIDGAVGADPIEKIHLGYYKRLDKISTDAALTLEIPIRSELEDALVLYGVYFYTNRLHIDIELTKEHRNTYKYFVEDILNDLNAEDLFITRNTINTFGHYDG